MPDKTGRLTEKEAAFVGFMAVTNDPDYSAFRAGYAKPVASGYHNAANPAIIEAVRRAEETKLTNTLLPMAVATLERLLDPDRPTADRVRLATAQTVLKYTLGDKEAGAQKEPHEMTPAELQARIDVLRDAMASKAKPVVDASPIEKPSVFD